MYPGMNKNPRFFVFDYYYQIKPSLSGTEKSGNLLLPNQSFINLGGWPKYRQCKGGVTLRHL